MKKKLEKELEKMAEDHIRWRHFFEILKRYYKWFLFSAIVLYLIDDPNVSLFGGIASYIKKLLGVH